MKFKTDRIRKEWLGPGLVWPELLGIVDDASDFANDLYQWEFVITCLLRTPEENDKLYAGDGTHLRGVHVEGRGCDVRTRGIDPDAIAGVSGYINSKYVYDPERPNYLVCLPEKTGPGSSGRHLHFQVHPRTVPRFTQED